jgi:hypothetical protein
MPIKHTTRSLLAILCLILLASCQKEVDFVDIDPPGPPGAGTVTEIKGDWNIVSQAVKSKTTVTMNEAGEEFKMIATSDYLMTHNEGKLKVTDAQFLFTGMTYTVDATANVKTYLGGLLIDDSDFPLNTTLPPTDNTIDYVRNAGDSVTFSNLIAMLPDPSGTPAPTPVGPSGAHVYVAGDTLYINFSTTIDAPIVQAGEAASMSAYGKTVMKFVH